MAEQRDTIPISGRLDDQAHDVTDQDVVAGQGTGGYEAAPATAGHTRYEQLHGTPRMPVPASQFLTKTPAGRWLSSPAPLPAPGGQPDPRHQTGESHDGPLRWARCPDDERLHLLQPAEVVVAATGGQAEALCGHLLPAECLTPAHDSAGALRLACLAGITPHQQPTQPVLTTPGGG